MAVWEVYADTFLAGELANKSKFQLFQPSGNIVVRAIRTWITFGGSVTLSGLRMKIYAYDVQNQVISDLIYTSSNSYDLADLKETYDHGVKGIGFSFNDIKLKGGDTYYLVLNADDYVTPTTTDYIAWVKAWPDPNTDYTQTFTVNGNNFLIAPYRISGVLGSKF